jgi:cell wall assembly regulator SMI1
MANPDEIRVEDLEVSVRTHGELLQLGAGTLAELLALPVIEVRTALVARELRELFDELGVEYPGELRSTPEAPVLAATGTVPERWRTIEAWLDEHHPAEVGTFRPPAPSAAIATAEAALGLTLPEEYKAFVGLHDGQQDTGTFVGHTRLLAVGELAEAKHWLVTLESEHGTTTRDAADPRVAPVGFPPSWVPIASISRTYLCLDLAPGSGGAVGQIVAYHVDDDDRPLIASSFADLLSVYFTEAQTGAIELAAGD